MWSMSLHCEIHCTRFRSGAGVTQRSSTLGGGERLHFDQVRKNMRDSWHRHCKIQEGKKLFRSSKVQCCSSITSSAKNADFQANFDPRFLKRPIWSIFPNQEIVESKENFERSACWISDCPAGNLPGSPACKFSVESSS